MKNNKLLWKIFLVPAILISILGLIGLFYPYLYMNFYLVKCSNWTWDSFHQNNFDVSLLLDIIFRAEGLAMFMSGIFAIFIIIFAFRKGEKWSAYVLAFVSSIALIGEILLEIAILK